MRIRHDVVPERCAADAHVDSAHGLDGGALRLRQRHAVHVVRVERLEPEGVVGVLHRRRERVRRHAEAVIRLKIYRDGLQLVDALV